MKNDREILIISLFTFLTVVSWITFEFLKTTKTSTVSSNIQELVVPLNPVLDMDTLKRLEKETSLTQSVTQ